MKGRELHDIKLERNKDYLRKKIGAREKWIDQYLTNDHMRGKVDEVLLLEDDTMAPLDYKYAEYKDKIYETYKQQLVCYAILIEQNFGKKVNRGFLVYVRSKNKLVEVEITESQKQEVRESIDAIQDILEKNHFPRATKYKKRCLNCTYRNICIR